MSMEEGASIWDDDDAAGLSQAGPSSSHRSDKDISADAQQARSSHSQKTSPLFDDVDAGWGTGDTPADDPSQHVAKARDSRSYEAPTVFESIETGDAAPSSSAQPPPTADDSFGDDFGPSATHAGGDDDGDEFGDFGDFDDADEVDAFDDVDENASRAQLVVRQPLPSPAQQQAEWAPLRLSKDTEADEIASRIRQILDVPLADGRPFPFHDAATSRLSQDRIRQVDGPGQILVTEASRKAWAELSAQPELKTVDWLRSKTRRTYLIAMGVPINLDELTNSGDSAKRLPPLTLNYDSKTERGLAGTNGRGNGSDSPSARGEAGRPAKSRESSKAPEMNVQRAKDLVGMSEDDLALLALPALRDLQREMEQTAIQASSLLTYYLQLRDTHAADNEMYNALIRDLVSGAAKRVGAGSSANAGRAGSVRRTGTPQSGAAARFAASNAGSGRNSPASMGGRTGSPRV